MCIGNNFDIYMNRKMNDKLDYFLTAEEGLELCQEAKASVEYGLEKYSLVGIGNIIEGKGTNKQPSAKFGFRSRR